MMFSHCMGLLTVAILPGLLWITRRGQLWDQQLFLRINTVSSSALNWLFQALWPLGTSFFLLLLLPLLFAVRWQFALFFSAGLLVSAGIERFIKLLAQRPRPFQTLPAATLRQKRYPSDTSFPSGDAVRVAFIAVGIAMGLPVSPPIIALLGLLALCVTVGRVFLGAHYPTDAWSGIVLGSAIACAWFQLYPFWIGWVPSI